MKYEKLGELAKIKTGKLDANMSDENGKYPFFTCSVKTYRINNFSYDCECVLVAGNGDLNVKYYDGKFDAYQRTYIIESINKEVLNTKFLYYFLYKYIDILRNNSIGGVIKYIKLGDLTEINIPLLSLDEQLKIVSILDKSQELMLKSKEVLDNLDELVKSRFIEMFGDPATNPKGWNISKIGDITKDVRYGTSKSSVEGGKYPYLRMNNITYNGNLDLKDLKYIDIEDNELEKCIVRNGDVLFNRTNSVELIGKTCVFNLEEPMIIAGYIIRVRLVDEVLPIYLSMFLNSDYGKKLLKGMAKGAVNQANINAQELKGIRIQIPPIELQNKFVDFINQVDKLKFEMEKSLKELEDNFSSLMHKAFKGELFS